MQSDSHTCEVSLIFDKQSIVSSLSHCRGHAAFQRTTGRGVCLVDRPPYNLANGRKLASESKVSGLFTAEWQWLERLLSRGSAPLNSSVPAI